MIRRITLNDLGLATLIGFVIGVSPLVPTAAPLKLVAGICVGAAVLGYRLYRRSQSGEASAEQPARSLFRVPLIAWVCAGLFVVIFVPTIRWMFGEWTWIIWHNAHGVFVPFVMAWLGYSTLKRNRDIQEEGSYWGLAFLIPGLLAAVLDLGVRTHYLASIGLVLCLPGLSLLFLGKKRTRALAVVLCIGAFMIPIPHTVAGHLYLQTITAQGVEFLVRELGIPVLRNHTVLALPRGSTFVVADSCSGFSTLYAAVGLSWMLAAYSQSHWRRVALVLITPPLAVMVNTIRVLILVLMGHYLGSHLLETPLHPLSGVFTFYIVMAALILIVDRKTLQRLFR